MTKVITFESQVTNNSAAVLPVTTPATADFSTAMLAAEDYRKSLFERWIKFCQVKEGSIRSYMKGAANFYGWLKDNNVGTITRETLIDYREHLGQTYKGSTANLYLTCARLFLGFLYTEKLIPEDVTTRVKSFKVQEGHKKDFLEAKDVNKILGFLKSKTGVIAARDLAMFSLMVTSGLRTVEVARLNVGSFVRYGNKVFIRVWGKGHDEADAIVGVAPQVEKMVREYLKLRKEPLTAESPLFASRKVEGNDCGRLSPISISAVVKKILRDCGYDSERLTAHSLRHTAATSMLLGGANFRDVQEALRHKSPVVTARYSHELDRINKNKAESLAAGMFDF